MRIGRPYDTHATASERLARKLRDWFTRDGHGSQTDLVKFSQTRPNGTKISHQNLSYFLNGHRVNPITLDDLTDIADYFRVSIGDLFDVNSRDLSGDEQRIVLAFRTLPRQTQEHFLALLEPASGPQYVSFRERPDRWRSKPYVEAALAPRRSVSADTSAEARTIARAVEKDPAYAEAELERVERLRALLLTSLGRAGADSAADAATPDPHPSHRVSEL